MDIALEVLKREERNNHEMNTRVSTLMENMSKRDTELCKRIESIEVKVS